MAHFDHEALWRGVCAPHFPEAEAAAVAAAILAAENAFWQQCETEHRSATLDHVFARAGVTPHDELLDSYFRAWEPHTLHRPRRGAAAARAARARHQDRRAVQHHVAAGAHERVFHRDEVLGLIDGAVYSSEIPWTKPHPEAFRAAMAAVGVTDPAACVFVGDRPYDDIFGAKSLGMRAVLIPNSAVPAYDGGGPGRGHHPPQRPPPPPGQLVTRHVGRLSRLAVRWTGRSPDLIAARVPFGRPGHGPRDTGDTGTRGRGDAGAAAGQCLLAPSACLPPDPPGQARSALLARARRLCVPR